ncbi:MAG TPA: hypothetical protein VEK08_06870, partial [Planctomycetota bacterium]|nr:hypothetical protein [Planctomycetota bacterium]
MGTTQGSRRHETPLVPTASEHLRRADVCGGKLLSGRPMNVQLYKYFSVCAWICVFFVFVMGNMLPLPHNEIFEADVLHVTATKGFPFIWYAEGHTLGDRTPHKVFLFAGMIANVFIAVGLPFLLYIWLLVLKSYSAPT